jgi:hypothetical protein
MEGVGISFIEVTRYVTASFPKFVTLPTPPPLDIKACGGKTILFLPPLLFPPLSIGRGEREGAVCQNSILFMQSNYKYSLISPPIHT